MVTYEEIEELEATDAGAGAILSAYLDLNPERRLRHAYRTAFENLVEEAHGRAEESMRGDLLREAARARAWLEGNSLQGKGLALFSCEARTLWQTYSLPVAIEDHVVFEPKPDIAPLLELLDEYERYAVALVDKERARLFSVFMGTIEESDAFRDFVPRKHDQGGPSQARFQRHHEEHVHRHLKRVAQGLMDLLRRRDFDRLILAGPPEATTELQHLLPGALAHRTVAVIPAEMFANEAEILRRTLEIESRVEREVEDRLLEDLLDRVGAGGRATRGMGPTLDALWRADVLTLVVAEGAHVEGVECPSCARLEPRNIAICPACEGATRPVHDLIHRAMGRAVEQAGRVEVLHGDAAIRLREVGEGIGSILRYQPAPAEARAGSQNP